VKIIALLAALAEIYLIRARYDLTRRIESDIREDEAEIARLRAMGADGHLAADRVLARILRAQGIAASITPLAPAARVEVAGGNDRANG
jgi:hypothetical protein